MPTPLPPALQTITLDDGRVELRDTVARVVAISDPFHASELAAAATMADALRQIERLLNGAAAAGDPPSIAACRIACEALRAAKIEHRPGSAGERAA